MGMFDTVIFGCPNCGKHVEIQTKAGKCNLGKIPCYEIPIEIALSIEGEYVRCENCDNSFQIKKAEEPITTIGMRLI